jgi:hypothetical protein
LPALRRGKEAKAEQAKREAELTTGNETGHHQLMTLVQLVIDKQAIISTCFDVVKDWKCVTACISFERLLGALASASMWALYRCF